MTSEQLADQVEAVIRSVRERIIGTGKEQYDMGETQKIELKDDAQILRETIEELDDAIVYLAHLRARVAQLIK